MSLIFNPSDRTVFPADAAPQVTEKVAHCQVCKTQWVIRSGNEDDGRGCSFCNGPKEAVVIVSEAPDYDGELV